MNRRLFCGGLLGLPAGLLVGKAETPMVAPEPALPVVLVRNTYTIDRQADRAEILRMIERNRERTIREVADRVRRGMG